MSHSSTEASDPFAGFEVIHSYTRRQAIDEGMLVDVSEHASEMGFQYPVALTSAVWESCCAWSDEDNRRQVYQDVSGRLHDVLWMAYLETRAANKNGSNDPTVYFRLYRVPRGGRSQTPREVVLKIHVGPGDNAEPVLTVMEFNES